jgi:hypothetical protein
MSSISELWPEGNLLWTVLHKNWRALTGSRRTIQFFFFPLPFSRIPNGTRRDVSSEASMLLG